MSEKTTKGYPFDKTREREKLTLVTYEYDLPFNYPNIDVWRKEYYGGEFHGVELLSVNKPSARAVLGRVETSKWTLMQTAVHIPPEVAFAEYVLDVADMENGETLWIADAFACFVDDEWNSNADIPAGAKNLISNPVFTMEGQTPKDWTLHTGKLKSIAEHCDKETGRTGVKIEGAQISLRYKIPVKPFQRIAFSLWVKSTNPTPRTVWLYPAWQDKNGVTMSDEAPDCIVVREEDPMVRVVVIGSACTPPGWITLECEPLEEEFYGRGDFLRSVAPVRFRQDGLWGMHLRFDQWSQSGEGAPSYEDIPEGMIKRYPGLETCKVKSRYQEFPFSGMSCAVFEIPKSRKVIIAAGAENAGFISDSYPDDNHYSICTIRTTVTVRE